MAHGVQRLAVDNLDIVVVRMPMFGETLFRLRVVVDDVKARDVPTADNILVVIRYRAPFAVDEILPVSQIARLLPNHIHIAGSITHRSIFLIEYRILSPHHVKQDTETRRIVGDVRILGPKLSAQTPSIRLVVLDKVRTAIILGIEEKNIHPNIWSLLPQLAGDFQQDTARHPHKDANPNGRRASDAPSARD